MDFVASVRKLVQLRAREAVSFSGAHVDVSLLMPGKMLRTRFAARLSECTVSRVSRTALQAACAATELVHTASLCHDDVVDNALLRRARPAMWRTTGPSGAVLVGDLLLCSAMELLVHTESGRFLPAFIAKVREVVEAEAEQELLPLSTDADEATCLRLARAKTGPLFAFVASMCGGDDQALAGALEEAGYCIGTAYQLADDMLDLVGSEVKTGKTLGTDRGRGKCTLPQVGRNGLLTARDQAGVLCRAALDALSAYPHARDALTQFFLTDLQPVFSQCGLELDVHMEHVV